jgi:hypothetical protein
MEGENIEGVGSEQEEIFYRRGAESQREEEERKEILPQIHRLGIHLR